MSTTEWTNPETGKKYPIGTEGLEHAINNNIALSFLANIARELYPYAKIPAALAVGLLDWDANAAVPLVQPSLFDVAVNKKDKQSSPKDST